MKDVPAHATVMGSPARDAGEYKRVLAGLPATRDGRLGAAPKRAGSPAAIPASRLTCDLGGSDRLSTHNRIRCRAR